MRIKTEGSVGGLHLEASLIKPKKETLKRCPSHSQSNKSEIVSQIAGLVKKIMKRRCLRKIPVLAAGNLNFLPKFRKMVRKRQIKIRKSRSYKD